ncbi:hypothetical protein PROFUN_02168 [Planoprotostelium fungivorum]|uniref:Uncharacterized protein n=1 Tax=Planoprotostelium fungivorum TaxID=1890364 RepID=A0A2P6NZB7_9EUKA|nr:hypothetical protein PROFUN_02168 [Planoprotostelium fungivorum]
MRWFLDNSMRKCIDQAPRFRGVVGYHACFTRMSVAIPFLSLTLSFLLKTFLTAVQQTLSKWFRPGSNRGPHACEACVITNYTTKPWYCDFCLTSGGGGLFRLPISVTTPRVPSLLSQADLDDAA